jgi:phosphoglycerol transferase MdoB-like AlkP superfamily enzyme
MVSYIIGVVCILLLASIGIYFVYRGITFDKNKQDDRDDSAFLGLGEGSFFLFVVQLVIIGLLAFAGKFPNWVTKTVYILTGLIMLAFAAAIYFS